MQRFSRKMTALLAAFFALIAIGAAPAHAQMKIGVVDIDKVFGNYYKTKIAEDKLNEAREAARKETDRRWAARVPLLEAMAQLNRDIDSKSQSPATRADKIKRREETISQIQAIEREVEQLNYTREMAIREQASRSRAVIVEDIMKVVNERAQAGGYDVVFDKSGSSMDGVRALLASRADMDFTEDVVAVVNKNQASEPAPPASDAKQPPKKTPAPKK